MHEVCMWSLGTNVVGPPLSRFSIDSCCNHTNESEYRYKKTSISPYSPDIAELALEALCSFSCASCFEFLQSRNHMFSKKKNQTSAKNTLMRDWSEAMMESCEIRSSFTSPTVGEDKDD